MPTRADREFYCAPEYRLPSSAGLRRRSRLGCVSVLSLESPNDHLSVKEVVIPGSTTGRSMFLSSFRQNATVKRVA